MATSGPIICTIEVHLAWWFYPYVYTLKFFCLTFGMEPDWEKVDRVIKRAARFRINGGRWRRDL